jgi:Spy/CpxP family protein refolding chaperone
MKITHTLTVLGFALALGSSLLPAMAQGAPAPAPGCKMCPGPEGRRDMMMKRMADKLQLTEAQRASCKAVIEKHKGSLKAKGMAAREARKAFFEAMKKPDTAPDTLKALNRAQADTRLEATLERRALRQELRAILTPEQREKAAFMMGQRMGMRHGGPGGWEGRGGFEQGRMGGGSMKGECPCGPAAPAPKAP